MLKLCRRPGLLLQSRPPKQQPQSCVATYGITSEAWADLSQIVESCAGPDGNTARHPVAMQHQDVPSLVSRIWSSILGLILNLHMVLLRKDTIPDQMKETRLSDN